MKWSKWLAKWDMASLKFNASFLEIEFKPNEADKDAAWEMYIELLTRISTQELADNTGDESTALQSVYSLFETTRDILKYYKRDSIEFTKIAVVVLNQVVRPFTARWHLKKINGSFADQNECLLFREELEQLQVKLRKYSMMLADMAGVEDLTFLEESIDS